MSTARSFARKFLSVHPIDVWFVDLIEKAPPPPEPSRFELREITSPDDPLLDDLDTDTFDRAYYRMCLARGDRGFAALDGEICAGRTWISTSSHRDKWSGQRVRMGPGDAWDFGTWIEPRYRRLGVVSLLLTDIMRELPNRGVTHLYTAAESKNTAIQSVGLTLGFEKHEHLVCARFLNRIGVQVPFTLRPRTGPSSRAGTAG